jgi:hypothetical protein
MEHFLPIELIDIVEEYDDGFMLRGNLSRDMLNCQCVCENTHSAAIEWIRHNVDKNNLGCLGCVNDNELVQLALSHVNIGELAGNPCDVATEYVLSRMGNNVPENLSKNGNPKAIDFLLAHPNSINWDEFINHPDDRIVDTFMKLPCLYPEFICMSQNEELAEWAVKQLDSELRANPNWYFVGSDILSKNGHPTIVKWFLDHPSQLYPPVAIMNPDDRIVNLVMDGIEKRVRDFDSSINILHSKNVNVIDWVCSHLDGACVELLQMNPLIFVSNAPDDSCCLTFCSVFFV